MAHAGATAWQLLPFRRVTSKARERFQTCVPLRTAFEKRPDLKTRLTQLPLFPSGTGYRPLSKLSLPGTFQDPLGLAEVVDVGRVRELLPFLEELGATTLSLPEYIKRHLASALQATTLTLQLRRELVALLIDRSGEFLDDQECHRVLASAPIVECTDGTFVPPDEAYFDSPSLSLLQPLTVRVAAVPASREHATRELFTWLGVAAGPRFQDLHNVLVTLTEQAPTPDSRAHVSAIFEHLGARLSDAETLPRELGDLRTRCWLPAQGDSLRWWAPRELAASYNQELFASQAAFLDVDRDAQQRCATLISLLAIQAAPSVQQVVRHLLHCSLDGYRSVTVCIND